MGGLRGSGLDALLLDPVVFPAAPTAWLTKLKDYCGFYDPHANLQGRSGKHKRSHSLEELLWCWRPLRQGQLWHHSLQVELAKLIKAADSGIGSSFLLSLPHLFREIIIRRSLNNLPVSSPSLDWGTAQTPIQVSLGL